MEVGSCRVMKRRRRRTLGKHGSWETECKAMSLAGDIASHPSSNGNSGSSTNTQKKKKRATRPVAAFDNSARGLDLLSALRCGLRLAAPVENRISFASLFEGHLPPPPPPPPPSPSSSPPTNLFPSRWQKGFQARLYGPGISNLRLTVLSR